MLGLLIWQNLRRERRRKSVAVASVALGMAVVTALVSLGVAAGEQAREDLRLFGANLVVEPRARAADPAPSGGGDPAAAGAATFDESLLDKLQSPAFFWKNTIRAVAPELRTLAAVEDPAASDPARRIRPVHIVGTWFDHALARPDGDPLITGLRQVHPAWQVFPLPERTEPGRWPTRDDEALGSGELDPGMLARLGGVLRLSSPHGEATVRVVGRVRTGIRDRVAVYTSLAVAQRLNGTPGRIGRAWINAVLSPEPDPPVQADRLTPAEREKFDCTPYPETVAAKFEALAPALTATPIRVVTRQQGEFLTKFQWLVGATTLFALITASFGVATAMHQVVLNRRGEIGLVRALGAPAHAIVGQFVAESALLAIAGGLAGFGLGQWVAASVGLNVLEARPPMDWVLLPPILVLAFVVTAAGCALPLVNSLRTPPAIALKRYGLA